MNINNIETIQNQSDIANFNIIRSISSINQQDKISAKAIQNAILLRQKYITNKMNEPVYPKHYKHKPITTPDKNSILKLKNGYYTIYNEDKPVHEIITYEEFLKDYKTILDICESVSIKNFVSKRLEELERKFTLHCLLNFKKSNDCCSSEDIHTISKVDTHIHAAASMTESELLQFLKEKDKFNKDDIVGYYTTNNGNKELETLSQMCKRIGVSLQDFTLNKLGVRASNEFFNRFDVFNASYKIGGEDLLRTVFLKCDNYMNGKYFAELIHQVFNRLNSSTYLELRLSIYGRSEDEWIKLANWVDKWDMKHKHNKWMIQFPRIYNVCKNNKIDFTFESYIKNLFGPLFEASIHPEKDPILFNFLEEISGFDSVDDESLLEQTFGYLPPANEWKTTENPPYFYYMYYLYANIISLNEYRKLRGMNTFDFRPHSGESGHICHLASTFLLSKGINHGVKLQSTPSLQYLFYLTQIGLAVSPLSNHNLFLAYNSNPFNDFFKRGLNVSLSSDDPLQFHRTQTPLIEEYAIAQQTWNYITLDMAEISYNSVLQSGFNEEEKEEMIGKEFWNFDLTNVSKTRLTMFRKIYRETCLKEEKEYVLILSNDNLINNSKLFQDIPYSIITIKYPDKGNTEDINVIKELEYWLDVRQKYQIFCSRIRTTKKSFFHPNSKPITIASLKNGIFNVYDEETCCEIDKFKCVVVYCRECKKKLCKECFKLTHKHVYHSLVQLSPQPLYEIIPAEQYFKDYISLTNFCQNGPARSFCFIQLRVRSELFLLYKLLNNSIENLEFQKQNIDFDKIIKIDTHVHANRSIHPNDLLSFIKIKLKNEPNRIVLNELILNDKKYKNIQLKQLFDLLEVKQFDLHSLGVQSDLSLVSRYDLWLDKYNPFGKKELKELFLSTNNDINGEYLCELLKSNVLERLKIMGNIKAEYRFTCSGSDLYELENLANKIVNYELILPEVSNYVIVIPRIYGRWKESGLIKNFSEYLRNIFQLCFEATLNPKQHQNLSIFLKNVGSFDSASEELLHEDTINPNNFIQPDDWNTNENPPYSYFMYYFYANIMVLNALRKDLNLNTFEFTPHCGESGDRMHAASAFLTANSIVHGVMIDKQNTIQYLYILSQMGISASPIEQNALYKRSIDPFNKMFERGMRICLSTDTPLHSHKTKEPLIEEYAFAMKKFKLTLTDLSEIARNSIIISSFPKEKKKEWIGKKFETMGPIGNDSNKTGIPDMRLEFRYNLFQNEVNTFEKWLKNCEN